MGSRPSAKSIDHLSSSQNVISGSEARGPSPDESFDWEVCGEMIQCVLLQHWEFRELFHHEADSSHQLTVF